MAFLPRRFLKRIKRLKLLFLFLGIIGLLSFSVGAFLKYQKTVLSFAQTPPDNLAIEKRTAIPINITIPSANINLSIEESGIVDGVWQISETGASFLVSSKRPGEGGNIVIYGHNKQRLFGNLINKHLEGQLIEIRSLDGKLYKYEVTESKIVNPTDIEEVLPTQTEVLTLYTCTGLLDSKRLIIKAVPTEINLK